MTGEEAEKSPQTLLTPEAKGAIEQHLDTRLEEKAKSWWKIAAGIVAVVSGAVGGLAYLGVQSIGANYIRTSVDKDVADVHKSLGRVQQAVEMSRGRERS